MSKHCKSNENTRKVNRLTGKSNKKKGDYYANMKGKREKEKTFY